MRCVARNSTLQTLDLYGCSLGEPGATQVAGALAVNTVLERLDLGANNIQLGGLALLSDSSVCNTALGALRLWGNHFQGFGMDRLLTALYRNDTLTELDLTASGADPDVTKVCLTLHPSSQRTRGCVFALAAC